MRYVVSHKYNDTNVYGMPCTVNYENESEKLVLLSSNECLLHAQLHEELCTVYGMPCTVNYENESEKLVLLSSNECLLHAQLHEELRTVYGMPCMVNYENESEKLVPLSSNECLLHAQLHEELCTVYGMPCTVNYENESETLVLLSSNECLLHTQLHEVLRTVYGMPCTVYHENELSKLVLLSSDERLLHECSDNQNIICNLMLNVNECVESVLSSYDNYITWECTQECVRASKEVRYKNVSLRFFPPSDEHHMSFKQPLKREGGGFKWKNKKILFLRSHSFSSGSIFMTMLKCRKVEISLRRSFMRKHDYALYCFELCLRYASSFSYGYCIPIGGKKKVKKNHKKKFYKLSSSSNKCMERNQDSKSYFFAGGRHRTSMNGEIVHDYLQTCTDANFLNNRQHFEGKKFEFKGYELLANVSNSTSDPIEVHFYSKIPLDQLSTYLNMEELQYIGILHSIHIPQRIDKKKMLTYFRGHHCIQCDLYVSVLTEKQISQKFMPIKKEKELKTEKYALLSKFPPDPPSNTLVESIIKGFCIDTAPDNFIEGGCAVCGLLSPIKDMVLLNEMDCDLNVISPGDIGRYERLHKSDPIRSLEGPILAEDCHHVCNTCQSFLKKNKKPPESLANFFWIGSIPSVLQNLTFAEKMLISKIRHNKCLVRVSSGRAKMTANVIMFSNPTVKVYHALPPSRREISEILAFVFQGPVQPTESDIKRTPMLVRRNVVKDALEWLKLNHVDYEDLQISFENLNDYPLAGVPVNIEYSKSDSDSGNKIASAMSVYDNEFEDGTTNGPCPFTVHGLTGPEFEKMSMDRLKARALQHLADKGSTLGISHDSKPQSMYDNPQAYPQMFPWLFPYGFGGIGQKCHFRKISETKHKKNLLMYHDKRFQTDFYFPMIAFNHEQLKAGVSGSFLLAKRKMWPDISNRLKSLNNDVLKNISNKLSDGGHFTPRTTEEKKCFQLLNDLDHVGGFVKGSITSKKHMRNEIWSMISQLGAPSWFITLSPADSRHPICLYYADKKFEFTPNLRSANERNLLIAQNPVAAARFFNFMVRSFIKHVLGIDTDHSGLYGDTAGYYGVAEQQGRLTLHLHMMLWIRNALSPQEIRDRLMNDDTEFQKSLIQYLEGCQKGEFLTGSMEYVKSKVPIDPENRTKGIHSVFHNESPRSVGKTYQDPTQTLPEKPPISCVSNEDTSCDACQSLSQWWLNFYGIVDDILLRSNVHKCSSSEHSNFKAKGCLNKDGMCKARFPRSIVPETTVNIEDGYINIKKLESMLNTISPCITYLLRCNTDVTSLLSGTSIKAVISYVTDYVAKPTLKTYQIFATAYNVFDRNANLDADDKSRTDDARKLILKIVNALSSKMEIGSPMASMYLLQNPDHYTSHQFIPFFWKSFVNEITKSEDSNENIGRNYNIDIKMEDVFQKEEEIFSQFSNNNKKEMQRNGTDSSEHEVDMLLSVNILMDINSPEKRIGGGSDLIYRDIDADIKVNDSFEFRELNEVLNGHEDDEGGGNEEDEEGIDDDLTDEKLLISQDGGEYVASSKVDDYKYRPELYASTTLYDWTRLSVKTKVSRKIIDKSSFYFLSGHSQKNSHVVKLVPSRSEVYLINFIGGPLPRCDQGDFEYYCRTMLTLFKPWRSSQDLRNAHQSWAEAFRLHEFNPEERRIMSNFNLRYECLDERDDYHAILKKQSRLKENGTSSLFHDQYDNECDLGIDQIFEEDYGDLYFLGPNAIKKAQQMIETELMMKRAHWSGGDESPSLQLNIEEFHPTIHRSGPQWKSLVKQSRENLLNAKKINCPTNIDVSQKPLDGCLEPLSVNVLPAEYFMQNFRAKEVKAREIISNTILDFSLNEEQRRAFHIIANHASEICPEQLKMHLGGMGGTGKTQVIKALISMFDQRKENHRFIVLAPTGTAAALLNGSTYHSVLGIRSSNTGNNGEEIILRNENSLIKEVQERLEGVNYIFIDEISMIACHELYAISSQLSKVTNEHNKPFGGKNIILAGDFAQLPPTNGSALYSNAVSKIQNTSMSKRDQESTIGKILWHQITTVVILTQNMRQTEMSEDDKKFRTALSNMRYAACTEDDLEFLKTLHVNGNVKERTLTNPKFRNVSVITSLNTQKDQINESCSMRFAKDTGQHLTHFYSIDKLGNAGLERKKRGTRAPKKASADTDIPINIQENLWDSNPHSSEHFPGKLSLCLGMPIMIRNNDATELCITKGQEAYVVGWDSIDGPRGRKVLETLFLELKNPPKTIQLPHLPRNVIPMTRTSKKIKCCLPNDYEMNVIRQQINVLPNFSMTDYGSQGKTRPENNVNLSHCKNFQSIYTCLSRSSNAAGTLIIQGFNHNKVTKGLPGHLRQEFRELNILNNITKEIYEGRLNKIYFGPLRNPMLYKYQTEIKSNVSDGLHRALKIQDREFIVKEKDGDGTWNISVYKDFVKKFEDKSNPKRKISDLDTIDEDAHLEKCVKKLRLCSSPSQNSNDRSPLGLTWDENDYSCAYDSLLTVLRHIWVEDQSKHRAYFEDGTPWLRLLHSLFVSLLNNSCTFESLRDRLRALLNRDKPLTYLYGKNYTDIDELIRDFTSEKSYGTSSLHCLKCRYSVNRQLSYLGDYTAVGWSSKDCERLQHQASIQRYLNYKLIKNDEKTAKICPECRKKHKKNLSLYNTQTINVLPSILIFALAPWIDINKRLTFDVLNSSKVYVLKGIIYSNNHHFTARLIDGNLNVWFHDGQTTRSFCQKEQSLVQANDIVLLKNFGQFRAILAFYVEQ